jgi:hypothetical protein
MGWFEPNRLRCLQVRSGVPEGGLFVASFGRLRLVCFGEHRGRKLPFIRTASYNLLWPEYVGKRQGY